MHIYYKSLLKKKSNNNTVSKDSKDINNKDKQ